MKKVCFITRRYSGSGFWNKNQDFYNEVYAWVSNLNSLGVKAIYVIGSDGHKIEENQLGRFYYIKDKERKSALSFSKEFFKAAAKVIEDEQVDIIHGHGLQDIYSFTQIRNYIPSKPKLFIQDHASDYHLKYKIYKKSFDKVDGVFFNSPGQESDWVKYKVLSSNKVYYAPEGVVRLIAQQGNRLRLDHPQLLWVGDLNANKRPQIVIKSMQYWKDSIPEIKLTMVFRQAPLLDKIKKMIIEYGLEDNVRLIGKLAHKDLLTLYGSKHYFILASKKEGSGYAAMEAMAAGLVPILSDIPSFRDFTDNGNIGLLFDAESPQSLTQGFLKLYDNDYANTSQRVIDRYDNCFSAKAKASKHMDAYFGRKKSMIGDE